VLQFHGRYKAFGLNRQYRAVHAIEDFLGRIPDKQTRDSGPRYSAHYDEFED
jgi:hypothetical protein